MEAKDPHVFEANKSNLRVFSMTEVGYGLGMMFGPLLTGSIFEGVGFFWMTVALGKLRLKYDDSMINLLTRSSYHLLIPGRNLMGLVRYLAST